MWNWILVLWKKFSFTLPGTSTFWFGYVQNKKYCPKKWHQFGISIDVFQLAQHAAFIKFILVFFFFRYHKYDIHSKCRQCLCVSNSIHKFFFLGRRISFSTAAMNLNLFNEKLHFINTFLCVVFYAFFAPEMNDSGVSSEQQQQQKVLRIKWNVYKTIVIRFVFCSCCSAFVLTLFHISRCQLEFNCIQRIYTFLHSSKFFFNQQSWSRLHVLRFPSMRFSSNVTIRSTYIIKQSKNGSIQARKMQNEKVLPAKILICAFWLLLFYLVAARHSNVP